MTTQNTATDSYAYLSGLLRGWAWVIENKSRPMEELVKEMIEESHRLAKMGNVTIDDE